MDINKENGPKKFSEYKEKKKLPSLIVLIPREENVTPRVTI